MQKMLFLSMTPPSFLQGAKPTSPFSFKHLKNVIFQTSLFQKEGMIVLMSIIDLGMASNKHNVSPLMLYFI